MPKQTHQPTIDDYAHNGSPNRYVYAHGDSVYELVTTPAKGTGYPDVYCNCEGYQHRKSCKHSNFLSAALRIEGLKNMAHGLLYDTRAVNEDILVTSIEVLEEIGDGLQTLPGNQFLIQATISSSIHGLYDHKFIVNGNELTRARPFFKSTGLTTGERPTIKIQALDGTKFSLDFAGCYSAPYINVITPMPYTACFQTSQYEAVVNKIPHGISISCDTLGLSVCLKLSHKDASVISRLYFNKNAKTWALGVGRNARPVVVNSPVALVEQAKKVMRL